MSQAVPAPLRPPFIYYGGKQRTAAVIAGLLPAHTHYVEPFAGSLAVLLAKTPAKLETVNDLDGDLMLFWRVLRDQPDDLARVCALTPHSRTERALATERGDDLSDLERARRVWVCLTQGRTGTLRPAGWRFDSADDAHTSMPSRLASYVARLEGKPWPLACPRCRWNVGTRWTSSPPTDASAAPCSTPTRRTWAACGNATTGTRCAATPSTARSPRHCTIVSPPSWSPAMPKNPRCSQHGLS
jgi:hypothetical protein